MRLNTSPVVFIVYKIDAPSRTVSLVSAGAEGRGRTDVLTIRLAAVSDAKNVGVPSGEVQSQPHAIITGS